MQGPPPGGSPLAGAPVSDPIVATIMANTGQPQPVVEAFLSFVAEQTGPGAQQAIQSFVALPTDRQRAIVAEFAAMIQGGVPAGPPPGAPVDAPGPASPPPGAMPVGGPPPSLGPAGPPPQGGPAPMMGPPGMMGPPPGMLAPPIEQTEPPAKPKEPETRKAKDPRVTPWKPAPVEKIVRRSPWKDRPFTWDEVMDAKQRGVRYWQPRQQMIQEQQRVIYRRPIFEAADGTPLNPAEGEVMFLRSKPARDFERYCSLAEPTQERIRRQLKPRVQSDKVIDAAQIVENVLRDQDHLDEAAWRERTSIGDPQPLLPYKDIYLLGAQGGIAWCYQWNDGPDQERHPYIRVPIPWSEVFPVGGVLTLRVTRLPLGEARAMYTAIRDRYPKREADAQPGEGYPDDNTPVEIVGCGDVWGQWWGLAWDFADGMGKDPDGKPQRVKSKLAGQKDNGEERWIVPPKEINYGIPYYRVLIPRATAAPALDDDQDERIRNTARGVLADRLGDVRMQDQLTSAMATGAIKAIDPPVTVYLSPEREKDDQGVLIPPSVNRGIGGRTYLMAGPTPEKLEEADASFTKAQDVANMLGMLGSDDQDASPAVLAGRDAAPSGFARALGSEAAAALYVDPLQRAMMQMRQMIDADRCILLHRALSGDDPLLTGLPVAGNDGEVELTAKHLELAGNETTITYRDTNMATRLQLLNLFERMIERGMLNKALALDEMGFEEPEVILQNVLKDQATDLPPFREMLIEREVMEFGDDAEYAMFQRGLQRLENQGKPPAPPGTPSPAGAPPMPGGTAVPPQIMG